MELNRLSEQEIINAICVYIGRQHSIKPEDIMVELLYSDEKGFSAEAEYLEQRELVTEGSIIQALRKWIQEQYGLDPYSAVLQLELTDEEGIIAFVE